MKKLLLVFSIVFISSLTVFSQGKSKKEFNVWGLPSHVPVGHTINCTAILEPKHIPDSVEIDPTGGISVSDWKKMYTDRNRVGWSFKMAIDNNAGLGKRQIVIKTQDGRTKPNEIEVVTHIPVISDFKIISKNMKPAEIKFSFKVSDSKADLGDLKGKVFLITLTSPGQFMGQSCLPSKVTKVNSKNYIVEIKLRLENNEFFPGTSCDLKFNVSDKNGYESMDFIQSVSF